MEDILINLERTNNLSNGAGLVSLLKEARPMIAQELIKPHLNIDFNRLFERRISIYPLSSQHDSLRLDRGAHEFAIHGYRGQAAVSQIFSTTADTKGTAQLESEFIQSHPDKPKTETISLSASAIQSFCTDFNETNPLYLSDDYAQLVGLQKAIVPFHYIVQWMLTKFDESKAIEVTQLRRLYIDSDCVLNVWDREGTIKFSISNNMDEIAYAGMISF